MSFFREDIVDIELGSGSLFRSFANKTVGEGDANANRYGVRVFKGEEPVNLSGHTVTGYFIRADETTVIIEGVATGNTAYVNLPENCYAIEGNFSLAIKITGAGVTGTMRIIDGTVNNTATGDVIDPGGIVPDIDELLAVIERAEDAAEAVAKVAITEELISGDDYRLIVNVTT